MVEESSSSTTTTDESDSDLEGVNSDIDTIKEQAGFCGLIKTVFYACR